MLKQVDEKETRLSGIGASPGICIGKAYLVGKEGVDVINKYFISEKNLQDEINRFKTAVKKAKDELRSIIESTPEELKDHASILDMHIVLLNDKMFYGQTVETIQSEHVNAEWALKIVVSQVKSMFQVMEDDYLKQRAQDVVQVHDRIMRHLTGGEGVNIGAIDKRVILVAHDLSPAQTSQIQLERIKGFVTDLGGKATHTGIIARTLGIPAVMGLKNASNIIKNDELIIVDGTTGQLIINPSEKTLIEYEERSLRYEAHIALITRESYLPAETQDGHRLKIMGNIELPEEVVSVRDKGGEGVGLYRTEFQYLSRNNFPSEFELYDKYRDVLEVMAPQPVTFRTLDINGDKAVGYASASVETNPALGLRAIRYCLKKTDVFQTQLRAILRAAAHGNARIMFPMISSLFEIKGAISHLDQAAESLEKEGVAYNRDIKVGIMIEIPSAVVLADVMAKEVDFFSIGTNDLIQYSLAIDRGNSEVAHLYNPLHPAVLRMLKHVANVSRDQQIDAFLCGEMAADPFHTPFLIGIGINELSMNPQSIPGIKRLVRSIALEEARNYSRQVLGLSTVDEILQFTQATYGAIISDNAQID
jgi:phosphotransferase system enzyme I (PtsI)